MAFGLGFGKRAFDQHLPDAAVAKRRLDRERAKKQCLRLPDTDWGEPYRADEQRADAGREGQIKRMVAPLTQPIGGLGIASRTEGALMQPLDPEALVGDFRPD